MTDQSQGSKTDDLVSKNTNDLEDRIEIASVIFSDQGELRTVFPIALKHCRELQKREHRMVRAANSVYRETLRAFVSIYSLYLACAKDRNLANAVDRDCLKATGSSPTTAELIVQTYMSEDPMAVQQYGRALVGAALNQYSPSALLDELSERNVTIRDLAVEGGLKPQDEPSDGYTILTLMTKAQDVDPRQHA